MSSDKSATETNAARYPIKLNLTPLHNQHGPIDRRKLLTMATTGVIGTVLGARAAKADGLFSRLMGIQSSRSLRVGGGS